MSLVKLSINDDTGKMFVKTSQVEIFWNVDVTYESTYKEILSPTFRFLKDDNSSEIRLQLNLYPNGSFYKNIYDSADPWVSLYIKTLVVDFEGSFILSLFNQSNEKIIENKISETMLKTKAGFGRFVKKSFLLDTKNNIIKDNQFTVSCRLVLDNEDILENKTGEQSFSRIKEFDEFERLLSDKKFSDLTISVKGKQFFVHKCILAMRSPVFDAMFNHDMQEKNKNLVEIEDFEPEVLQEFIRFIYSGKVYEVEKIVCELLTVAEKYAVQGLKAMCEEEMCKSLNEDNAIKYLSTADMNNASETKTKIIKWISLHIKNFLIKEEFKSFGATHPELFFDITKKSHNL